MAKFIYVNRSQTNQSAAIFPVHSPSQPIAYSQPGSERRLSDPSSCLPKGKCYPIPSFFDDRAKPKETELQ